MVYLGLQQFLALLVKSFIIRSVHYVETFFEICAPAIPIYLSLLLLTNSNLNPSEEARKESQRLSAPQGRVAEGDDDHVVLPNITFELPLEKKRINITYKVSKDYSIYHFPTADSVSFVENMMRKYSVKFENISCVEKFSEYGTTWNSSFSDQRGYLSISKLTPNQTKFLFGFATNLTKNYEVESMPTQLSFGQSFQFFMDSVSRDMIEFLNILMLNIACRNNQKRHECAHFESNPITYNWFPEEKHQFDRPGMSKKEWYQVFGKNRRKRASEYEDETDYEFYNGEMLQFVAISILIGFALIMPVMLRRIVADKETRVREFYRIMGVPEYVYWLSLFVSQFIIICLCTLVCCVVIFTNESDFAHTSFTSRINVPVFALFFLLSSVQNIFFSFFLSTLFNS